MIWRAFRNKRGSLFFGRRIEQAAGNLMAHFTRFKVKEGTKVDAYTFMPHEENPDDGLSLEEYFEKYHSN
ncbi:hypothetical protein [Acinetobacter colistiniresistens]|uniref:hypothetical protein n=1 Tax=Acinetobacter colistiniresistens TaxID=280145 RepID=UPI00124FA081|nr:hypothetical protein [Acinetobacter colistiniresistens]